MSTSAHPESKRDHGIPLLGCCDSLLRADCEYMMGIDEAGRGVRRTAKHSHNFTPL